MEIHQNREAFNAFATSRGQELLQPYRSHPFGIGRTGPTACSTTASLTFSYLLTSEEVIVSADVCLHPYTSLH